MKREYTLKHVITLTIITSALSCVVTALIFGIGFGAFGGRFKLVSEYAALLKQIDRLYIGEYNRTDVRDASMSAAVAAIGDRWSYYLTEEEYAEYLEYTGNSYAGIGIGIEIDSETGGMRVLYVHKGSAAEAANLLADDIIVEIDGEDITHLELDEMKEMITRELGETVDLTVIKPDGSKEKLTAVYSLIFVAPVSYEMLDNGIGYIELYNFAQGSADSFVEAFEELSEQGAQSMIFDVRNNGGGRVTEMTKILDYLLPEGEIFIAVGRNGRETITYSDEASKGMPAVVLVNRYSYSAAEYFAATLSEYGYAYTIGEQTTGKNRSQVTVTLRGGGALHISSGEYLTKNRVSLHDAGGYTPDMIVEFTNSDMEKLIAGVLEKEDDSQIGAAIQHLRNG